MNKQTDNNAVEEIDCLEAIDSLYAYLDGELDDQETLAKFKHHLKHCHSCATRSELESVISERLKTAARDQAPPALQNRLRDLMDKF